jgi:hypothetical protein
MTRSSRTTAFAIALFALAAASADAASDRALGKGLKLGLNSASMKGADADPGLTSRTGFAAGAFVTLGLTDRFAVQPEIIYTQKGAEYDSGPRPYEYQLSYVEVPLLCKLTLAGRGAAFRPNLYVGPFVGFKVSAKTETYLDSEQEESVGENFPCARRIDAGYAVGVGADLILGPGRALLDLRYGRSLVSAVTTGAEKEHSVVSAFLGYSFD